MKQPVLALNFIALILLCPPAQGVDQQSNDLSAKATALPIRKCEINDGTKAWLYPNGDPIGSLPLWRCTAEDRSATATFTQSPDGAEPTTEIVELCTREGKNKKCEAFLIARPAHRTADLAKYGVKERQFDQIECQQALSGGLPISVCDQPRAKEPGRLMKTGK